MNTRNFNLKSRPNNYYSKWENFDPKTYSPESFFKKTTKREKKRNK